MKSGDAGVKNSILTPGGEKKRRIHRISEIRKKYSDNKCDGKIMAILKDNATYSASAKDIAVQFCFFDIQLTSLSPRNCIPPEVLLLVSMHPA
ncbi:hypothetical protein Tco_1072803 [Tanacetum coccineum]